MKQCTSCDYNFLLSQVGKEPIWDGWVDGWMGGWMDGWMDGWVDGWMGGWMGGSMDDEWMDG